jgi:hypothetical protein
MILIGTDYMQPIGDGLTTLWEWVPTPSSLEKPPFSNEHNNYHATSALWNNNKRIAWQAI